MKTKIPNTIDFKGLTDWVEIFRGGRRTDSAGNTRNFTEADIDQIVNNHNPEQPVPHVITHKELYSPFAYAQGRELKRDGLSLLVKSDKVEPQFDKLLESGRLFNRSVRLKQTDNGLKLSHIAWLGAEPPAVEGLPALEYASEGEFFDYVSNWEHGSAVSAFVRLLRQLRTWIADKDDIESADRVIPEWQLEDLAESAAAAKATPDTPSDTDGTRPVSTFNQYQPAANAANHSNGDPIPMSITQEELDAQTQRADSAETENQALRQQLAQQAQEAQEAEFAAFIESAIDAGKLLPANKDACLTFMLDIAGRDSYEFGGQKMRATDWFKDFVSALGPQIALGDESGGHGSRALDSRALADKAREYQQSQLAAGVEISIAEAVDHINKEAQS